MEEQISKFLFLFKNKLFHFHVETKHPFLAGFFGVFSLKELGKRIYFFLSKKNQTLKMISLSRKRKRKKLKALQKPKKEPGRNFQQSDVEKKWREVSKQLSYWFFLFLFPRFLREKPFQKRNPSYREKKIG